MIVSVAIAPTEASMRPLTSAAGRRVWMSSVSACKVAIEADVARPDWIAPTVGTAAVTLAFMVAVRSPLVAALVRLVTVVIVPAEMFVGVAKPA